MVSLRSQKRNIPLKLGHWHKVTGMVESAIGKTNDASTRHDGLNPMQERNGRVSGISDKYQLTLRLWRHVLDHLVGEFFCDVFQAWLDEHVAAGTFMACFPDRRAGRGVDQP